MSKKKQAKRKPKKPRRVVLGVGHPWFGDNTVRLYKRHAPEWDPVPIEYEDLGNWNRIRLVVEVLK